MLATNRLKEMLSNMQTVIAKRKKKGGGREGEGGEKEVKPAGK